MFVKCACVDVLGKQPLSDSRRIPSAGGTCHVRLYAWTGSREPSGGSGMDPAVSRQAAGSGRHFFLVFYVGMMLFRTLLCRSIWGNPLDHVLGIWGLHNNGKLYTENFENLILFLPFIVLLFWAERRKRSLQRKKYSGCTDLKFQDQFPAFHLESSSASCFSNLERFQLTDLFFNTRWWTPRRIWYWGFDRSRETRESIRRFGGWDVTPWRSADEEQKSSGTYADAENPSMDRSVIGSNGRKCHT